MQLPVRIFILSLVLTITSGNLHAGLIDSGFTATYKVYKNETYLGTATRTLKRTSRTSLLLNSHTMPGGIVAIFISDVVDETSEMRLEGQDIVPLVYTYAQTGGKKDEYYQFKFDWEKKLFISTYNNKQHPMSAGTQGLISFQLQLMLDLQKGKHELIYDIADRKGIDKYHLKQKGSETITTDAGEFKTTRMESDATEKGEKYILWCAESLNFLPIQIKKIENDGDEIKFLLKSINL